MRFLVFAGSFEPHRAGENTFIGECDDLPAARRIADAHSLADWYLIYDRSSRKLTCIQQREKCETTHSFGRMPAGF